MSRDLDAVFFVDQKPIIAFRDGMFFVCFEVGRKASFEVVMSPNTFLKSLAAANEVAAKWQVGELDRVADLR